MSTTESLIDQGVPESSTSVIRRAHLRYDGTDTSLEVEVGVFWQKCVRDFYKAYRQRYGFVMMDKPLIIEAAAVEAIGRMEDAEKIAESIVDKIEQLKVLAEVSAYMAGKEQLTNIYDREHLQVGKNCFRAGDNS
ncbi:MAG: hypothetical protein Ct9H300mP19_17200 [Dehalococcoidia bacterium]|nr:MAG: hypothetical protein Ct9H300mP19_17200 [Dehalococcoidia bacterium]